MPFNVEMSPDNLFEASGGVLDLSDHSIAHITKPDNIGVGFILAFTLFGSLLALEARLVEIDIIAHGDSLGGDEKLKEGGDFGIPVLGGRATPCSQQTEADLAAGVEIGVESDLALSGGGDEHFWWVVGVRVIAVDIEGEGAIGVWGVLAAHDENINDIDSRTVASDEDGVGVLAGKGRAEVCQLLR